MQSLQPKQPISLSKATWTRRWTETELLWTVQREVLENFLFSSPTWWYYPKCDGRLCVCKSLEKFHCIGASSRRDTSAEWNVTGRRVLHTNKLCFIFWRGEKMQIAQIIPFWVRNRFMVRQDYGRLHRDRVKWRGSGVRTSLTKDFRMFAPGQLGMVIKRYFWHLFCSSLLSLPVKWIKFYTLTMVSLKFDWMQRENLLNGQREETSSKIKRILLDGLIYFLVH